MATKRPSYVSIRRRQRNIIEGIGTRNLSDKEAAKEFGVTRPELKRFKEAKPKDLRKIYNRSASARKLYAEGERTETRRILGIKRIRVYEWRENVLRPMYKQPKKVSDVQIGRMIQALYEPNHFKSQAWAIYARDHNIPSSIDSIKLLHRNGRTSHRQYSSIIKAWAAIYGIKGHRVNEMLDEYESEDYMDWIRNQEEEAS